MTLHAQRRNLFLEVRREFDLVTLAILVGQVSGVAAHIESRVTAAVLRNIHSNVVAGQAKILVARRSRRCFQKLLRIV